MSVDEVPTNLYPAADWLRYRHPFLDDLVRRVAGDLDDWLDEIAGAVFDTVDNGAAWQRYGRDHPAPTDPDDEDAYYRWEDLGPKNTSRGNAYAVMSSGEERTVRLVATLANIRVSGYQPGTYELTSYQRFIPWSVHDVGRSLRPRTSETPLEPTRPDSGIAELAPRPCP